LYPKQLAAIFHDKRIGCIEASAQPVDSLIPTPNGWKRFGDLAEGDFVFAVDGTPTEVVGIFPQGDKEVFKFTFGDGTSTESCDDHLWLTEQSQRGARLLTTKRIRTLAENTKNTLLFPICEPVQYPRKEVKIDPWLLGVLIGDGSLCGNAISVSSADLDLIERVKEVIPKGYKVVDAGNYCYRIIAKIRGAGYEDPSIRYKAGGYEVQVARKYVGRRWTYEEALQLHKEKMREVYGDDYPEINLRQELRALGLLDLKHNEKFVPDLYLYNCPEIRLEILRGLLDTDGSAGAYNSAVIQQTSKILADNIVDLVRSLGGFAKTAVEPARQANWKVSYRTNIRHPDVGTLFWLPRKRNKPVSSDFFVRKLKKIERVGITEVMCIAIAHPSSLYLTDDYIVTHNTKAGKTVACIIWILEQALQGNPSEQFWWIAPSRFQAKIAFKRMQHSVGNGIQSTNETDLVVNLINGTSIWFKTGEDPDKLYGEDVHAAVIDEASRVREEAFVAVRSTLTATRGPIRIIGNVKGRKNWFYAMSRRAEAGEPDMHFAKIVSTDAIAAGVIALEEVESARRQMPEAAFKELYLAEPADDGGNPFGGDDAIDRCLQPALSQKKVQCWGWDLAKSVDWTVGIGLDEDGRMAAFYRWQGSWKSTINRIREISKGVPTLIDATGVGDPVLEYLQETDAERGLIKGFKFTSASKQQLMEGLAIAIQREEVGFIDKVAKELKSFEYQYTRTGVVYCAPEGQHDDCVCGLALAWKQYRKPDAPAWVQAAKDFRPPKFLQIFAR